MSTDTATTDRITTSIERATPDISTWTPAQVIAAAVEMNADDPDWTPEIAAAVAAGTIEVDVSTSAPGNGYRVRVVAALVVSIDLDGRRRTVYATDVRMVHLVAKRNFGSDRMASWWAGKSFGGQWPVHHRKFI